MYIARIVHAGMRTQQTINNIYKTKMESILSSILCGARTESCQPFYVLQQTEDMSGGSIIVIVYNIFTVYTITIILLPLISSACCNT